MAPFKFRLEFLIKARRRKEEEAMARLAQRRASIRELESEIADTSARQEHLRGELSDMIREGRVGIELLKLYKDYDFKLGKDLKRLNEFLRLSRREEAKEQAALAQASVDRKIMEKLKEKKKAEYMQEQARLEQDQLEEMAALAKARRDRDNGRDAFGSR